MSVFWLSGISILWLTAVDIEFDSFLCLQIFERKKRFKSYSIGKMYNS